MNNDIYSDLNGQYALSYALNLIYAEDLKNTSKELNIKNEWLVDAIEYLVSVNSEKHIFTSKDKENIYSVLIELRFCENPCLTAERYNKMIQSLNLATSENSDLFLQSEFLDRSCYPKYNEQNVHKANFQAVKYVYQYDLETIQILLCSEQTYEKSKERFFRDENYIHSLVGLINIIPSILEDETILYRIKDILYTNKKLKRFDWYSILVDQINSYAIKLVKTKTRNKK